MSNIPEGATHENGQHHYKFLEDKLYIHIEDDGWSLITYSKEWMDKNLTPLQPTKWLPEVGQECEATFGTKKNWYKFVIAGNHGFILIGDYWQRKLVSEYENIEFRPLKTEREKFVDECVELKKAHMWTEEEFIGAIYDKGARFND